MLMMSEWAGMMQAPRWQHLIAVLFAGLAMTYALQFVDGSMLRSHLAPLIVQDVVLVGVAAILLAVICFRARLGAGLLYAVLPAMALIFIRQQNSGLLLALWTLVIVWATDIGAYFAGRAVGGPKLAPRISPNKTWAGLIGGMIAALIVGALIAWRAGLPHLLYIAGGGLAIAAQAGDLFESWLKRRSGVKDSGRILPGHGGVLDRLDGVVPVSILVAAAIVAELL
jgi:phosphatidate cytidylyltransferase